MKRKLIKQGSGGLTFYVPKDWTKSNNLNPGDEIDIRPIEGDLLISSKINSQKKEKTITLPKGSEKIPRIMLNSLYRLGYDKIIVNYSTKQQEEDIREIVDHRLLGFEITDEQENKIIIENVTEPSDEKQEVLVRRMFYIINDSFELLNFDLKNNKFVNGANIVTKTKRLNKYNSFCRRNITKRKFSETTATYSWELYQKMLLVQHSIWHFHTVISKEKSKKISKASMVLLDNIRSYYNQIHESFFKKDVDNLLMVLDKAKSDLYSSVQVQMKKTSGSEAIMLYYIGELYRLVYVLSVPLVSLLLVREE